MKACTKPKTRLRRGLETVEAAILLPIVLMVTFGALKYGWIFLQYHRMTTVARNAVRIAVLPGDRSALVTAAITNGMAAANITGYTPNVAYTGTVGNPVTVQITVPATPATNVDILPLPAWIPSPAQLTATATMSKEGFN